MACGVRVLTSKSMACGVRVATKGRGDCGVRVTTRRFSRTVETGPTEVLLVVLDFEPMYDGHEGYIDYEITLQASTDITTVIIATSHWISSFFGTKYYLQALDLAHLTVVIPPNTSQITHRLLVGYGATIDVADQGGEELYMVSAST